MNRLVLSILELSKYESGQMPAANEVFNLCTVADTFAKRILSAREDIRFENLLPEDLPVYSDMLQTEQILKSFLENTAAHTKENGRVTLSAEDAGDKVKIKVYNTDSKKEREVEITLQEDK